MSVFDPLLDLLFPIFCIGCGRFGTSLCSACAHTIHFYTSPLCPGCMKSLRSVGFHSGCKSHSHLDGLMVLATFDGVLKQLIAEVKYEGYFDELRPLIALLPFAPGLSTIHPRVIIPVPLHPNRLTERGFNQSAILAKGLSKKLQIPFTEKLLLKTAATPSQMQLKRSQRLSNLQDAFSCTIPLKKTDSILLIDDVVTTGATLSCCAQVLKKAGAGKVYGLALAHGK